MGSGQEEGAGPGGAHRGASAQPYFAGGSFVGGLPGDSGAKFVGAGGLLGRPPGV